MVLKVTLVLTKTFAQVIPYAVNTYFQTPHLWKRYKLVNFLYRCTVHSVVSLINTPTNTHTGGAKKCILFDFELNYGSNVW